MRVSETKLRKALVALCDLENPEHADCCEGCLTCDIFNAVDAWLAARPTKKPRGKGRKK